jgi:hypothetical protein
MIQTIEQTATNNRQQIGYSPSPLPPLVDPRSKESQLGPSDFRLPSYRPSYDEDEVKRVFEQRFTEAINAHRNHYSEWFTAWSFYRGDQWRAWSKAHNRFLDTFPGPGEVGYDSSRRHRCYNHISPLVDKTKAKALMNDPSATISPLTGQQTDVQGAREGRAVISHLSRRHDTDELSDELADWCLQVAAPCLKIWWDQTLSAFVPIIDPAGRIIKIIEQKNAGDVNWQIVSPFEWMPDPKAKRFKEMAYIFHAQVVASDYLRQRYKEGARVQPDAYMGTESGVEARMAAITGDAPRGSDLSKPDGCLLKEMFERETLRYPKGRYIVMAGGIVLEYAEEWPDGDGSVFPFVPYYYKKGVASVYGRNAVTPLRDAQILINKAMSRKEEWMDSSDWFIAMPHGAEMGADTFESVGKSRLATKIYHNPGLSPQVFATPPMSPNMSEVQADGDNFMRDNIGVHEVSDGRAPAGVDAGVAIQLLQQSDDTQLGPFRKLITSFWCKVYEITLQIGAKRYINPRLLMMQDTAQGDPNAPRSEVTMFQHLSQGRLVIAPGSSTGENPTIRTQKILDMAGKGMLNPDRLPVTISLLELLGFEKSDKVIDDLTSVAQQMQAQQPNPAALEQMKQQAATAMLNIQTQAKEQLALAVEKARTEREAEIEAIRGHSAQELEKLRAANNLNAQRAQIEANRQLMILNGQIKAMQEQLALVQIQLKGTLDPTAVADLERRQGLNSPDDATVQKLTLAPVSHQNTIHTDLPTQNRGQNVHKNRTNTRRKQGR